MRIIIKSVSSKCLEGGDGEWGDGNFLIKLFYKRETMAEKE